MRRPAKSVSIYPCRAKLLVPHLSHGTRRIGNLRSDIRQPTITRSRLSLAHRGNRTTATTDLLGLTTTRLLGLASLTTTTSQVCRAELIVSRTNRADIRCVVGCHRSGTHTQRLTLVESLATSATTRDFLAATATGATLHLVFRKNLRTATCFASLRLTTPSLRLTTTTGLTQHHLVRNRRFSFPVHIHLMRLERRRS